jgi:hypothetical protein
LNFCFTINFEINEIAAESKIPPPSMVSTSGNLSLKRKISRDQNLTNQTTLTTSTPPQTMTALTTAKMTAKWTLKEKQTISTVKKKLILPEKKQQVSITLKDLNEKNNQ